MINISSSNPSSKVSFRNKNIDGFTFIPVLVGGGNLGGTYVDLTQMNMKGVLRRNGVETVLFNTTVFNLLITSLYFSSLWNYMFPTITTGLNCIAGPTKLIVPLRIDLGGPINLTGNDELTIEWQLNATTFFTATNVTVGSSYIQMDETETQEIEFVTPILDVRVVEGSQQNVSYSLGDNVLSIIVANYDKTTNYTYDANNVINYINLTSSTGINKNDNFYELVTKCISYFPTSSEGAVRYQNFALYSGGDEIDGVKLDLNLVTANVTSSKNFIITRSFVTDNWLVTRAQLLKDKKDQSADNKGQFDEALVHNGRNRN